MFPSNGVSRIKLKRDLFKVENKLEPNKRRWTGPKTVSGLNPPADSQAQDQVFSAPENTSPNGHELSSSAEHDDGRAGYNTGTLPSRVMGFSDSLGEGTGPCTRSQSESHRGKRLREHKKEKICYRLRFALCFGEKKRRGGVRRKRHGPTVSRRHALSYINSNVSVKPGNISIKSTVHGETVEPTLPAQGGIKVDPKYVKSAGVKTGGPDILGQGECRRGPGRPRKVYIHSFGESAAQVKTTIKTEVRRAHASKTRRGLSGQAPNISSKVELRRCLRSRTRLSSKKDLKRLVKNSCCALCGDIKYSPPPCKNLAHLLKHRPRAGRPSLTGRRKSVGNISQSPQPLTTPSFQNEKYPVVKLCDVARVFEIASCDFSCVLPAMLKGKRKKVRCLKKEFRFLVHPHLRGTRKHRSKIANQSWEIFTPTNSCASFSSGDSPSGATGGKYVLETAVTQDGCVKDCDGYLARSPDCKRMRQVEIEGTTSVLPRSPREQLLTNGGPSDCYCEREKACPMKNAPERCEGTSSLECRVPPLILRRVTAAGGCGFRGEDDVENGGLSLDEGEKENGRNEDSEDELNSPESFSCQRTQAYVFIPQSSCARICKTWPFPRSGPPDELRSTLHTGPRWIVNTSFLATVPTSLSIAPNCLLDKDVQIKLCEPTEQSLSSAEIKEVLEMQTVSSVSVEEPSRPAELESNQSVQGASEDFSEVLEFFTPGAIKQVSSCKLTGLGHVLSLEGSSPKSQPAENHSLLNTPNRKALSSESKNQHDITVIGMEDPNSPKRSAFVSNSECTQISTYPVSRTTFACQVENQDGPQIYNPDSLSELCLKVKTLKAQHPSSLINPSAAEQGTPNDVPLGSNPSSSGKSKQRKGFDRYTITDSSSSADENDSSLSSEEDSGEHDDEESLRSNDDGTIQMKDEDKGFIPPQSPECSVVPNSFLDVSRAYEEDVLVLDVIQDDPELFGAVDTESIKKMDTMAEENRETQSERQTGSHCKIVWDLDGDRSSKSVPTDPNIENVEDRSSQTVDKVQSDKAQATQSLSCLQVTSAVKPGNDIDLNNNQEVRSSSNLNGFKVINTRTARPVMDPGTIAHGNVIKEMSASRASNNYCWFYFNEHDACLRSACWFLHTLKDGDEQFCMETVRKFCYVGNPAIVLRAVELCMGYYRKCSPSLSFSQATVNTLLSCLLNLGLLREFVEVINLLLTHKRLPPPEIVLAAFKHVRERGLTDSVPELILLTSKIVETGCVFGVDHCEVMQSHLQMMQLPRPQMDIFLAVKCRALATNPHTAELSDLAQAVVRVEMLKHQEEWCRLAHVFCDVYVGPHSPTELNRFFCCVTMALLKEPIDKLSLPYELFAESVCQQFPSNNMVKNILGRIGVSLIFRYYRTREWNKGVKLVSVMFGLQIEFATLKGFLGNEHQVSRCQLVTIATELFLHSGSIEGALKMLRADDWFVTSDLWPCDPADIECRKRVLTLLAGKTAHRDTFDILTNLPGLRQPISGVHVNDYTEMFRAHLRLCVMKQALPVAADILEFMLIQGMAPETPELQNLIHKLGKQNNWSRARSLFKRARSVGFYSAVVCERDSLFLPCSLSEIEMTLAFEMFISSMETILQTPAGPSQPLLITLRRHGDVEDITESVYLAAGCRLLSAALIPNPKLTIRYTAVNQSQEQLFILDRGSALKWLSQNERWALKMWVS